MVPEADITGYAAQHKYGAIVKDVWKGIEYEEGHIRGATIPLAQLPHRASEVAGGGPVCAIFPTHNRSYVAAELLCQRGIDARSDAEGTTAWARTGRPVVPGRGVA